MIEMIHGGRVCLLDEDYAESFAFKAARMCGARGFHVAYNPGSRSDFLQALQQLGAEPKVYRLQNRRNPRRMMRMRVSCSQDDWIGVFGEPECVEELSMPALKQAFYRWKHFCSDGAVTCVGHLFEQSPEFRWMVVMRVAFL